MYGKRNVTISLDENELKTLIELNEELNRLSIKEPNRTEAVKYAIKFTRGNFHILKIVEDLKKELEKEKQKNKLFEQSFIEFQNKIKLF